MKIPKSKNYSTKVESAPHYIKNVIETIQLDQYTTIEINVFYDTIHKGNRYSLELAYADKQTIRNFRIKLLLS